MTDRAVFRSNWCVQALGTLCACIIAFVCPPVIAAVDIAGQWQAFRHEDRLHRGDGADLGDYTGLPINAAARQKARSWDPSVLSLPERQTTPHPLAYAMHGPAPNIRIDDLVDPATQDRIAYRIAGLFNRAQERMIWMDGRAHPSKLAEHTWAGFSTGRWQGNVLVVTTTHLKMGFIERNGVPSSPYATMEEHFVRHGDQMMALIWVNDPVYLEEPLVRTANWRWAPTQRIGALIPSETADELGSLEEGTVPSLPLGTVHREFAEKLGLPLEAVQGGAKTLYPEFGRTLR